MSWNDGSRWQRWDPHLHAPGTLRNDQFKGDWDGYLRRIENAKPAPVALGITDYFTMRAYKEVLSRKRQGALKNVPLVFANVELRLTIETDKRTGINLHLLVSPEDSDHVARMEERLASFYFFYNDVRYYCTDDGLIRLGRAHRKDANLPELAALSEGANQFKIDYARVAELFNVDPWFASNVLVAIAAGDDGLAGIAKDASFHAQREQLGRFADIIFSGSPREREYWLRNNPVRPCLHGSDAHKVVDVLEGSRAETPDAEPRRCWIRAAATFDGLRQTLEEPGRRVFIGAEPPIGPSPSNVIRRLRVSNAPWLHTNDITFNDGLVTVIGARGSGKTALADLIALGADAGEDNPGPASFIDKAAALLGALESSIEWGDGLVQSHTMSHDPDFAREARVRYLSQQFVENLCSVEKRKSSEFGEPLQREIEDVIFNSIPEEDRILCSSFSELRDVRLETHLLRTRSERVLIQEKTAEISRLSALQKTLPVLRSKLAELERNLKAVEDQLKGIPTKAVSEIVKQHTDVNRKLSNLKSAIAAESRSEQNLRDLKTEVESWSAEAESDWKKLRNKYEALMKPDDWNVVRLKLDSQALPLIERLSKAAKEKIDKLREFGIIETSDVATGQKAGLVFLEKENLRLTNELGLDQANAKLKSELEKRHNSTKQALEKLKAELLLAGGSLEKRKQVNAERADSYQCVFQSLSDHAEELRLLYAPLQKRLSSDERMSKLSFSVRREVRLDSWAKRGELLFDLRRPPLNGVGILAKVARQSLLAAWENGTPSEVRRAMEEFLPTILAQGLTQGASAIEVGNWLFSTDHINIQYSIAYEGVDLDQLSPGTRGVVLLTLYLGLDEWDLRPLIIDQPEENLDPRSIYQDLVPFFKEAAKRRQIIMVTHNANLVVNADSDQVIIARSTRSEVSKLPTVQYTAGGLEDKEIRKEVCRLLEGGQEAFDRRRRRYRPDARGLQ